MHDAAEILIDGPMSARGLRMLQAMAASAPPGSAVTASYAGQHRLLMLYGPGDPARQEVMRTHLQRGGRVLSWDLGYWGRDTSLRLALDGLHPRPAHLAMAPAEGQRRAHQLRSDAVADGPVLLVGLGAKASALHGLRSLQWERAALERIRAELPGRQVLWRPKGRKVVPLAGLPLRHGMPIEEALQGCSLVWCRHSNVAVDACIAGVPVHCEDGAGLALYAGNRAPGPAERAEFLRRLGWWNWAPDEAPSAWEWITRITHEA